MKSKSKAHVYFKHQRDYKRDLQECGLKQKDIAEELKMTSAYFSMMLNGFERMPGYVEEYVIALINHAKAKPKPQIELKRQLRYKKFRKDKKERETEKLLAEQAEYEAYIKAKNEKAINEAIIKAVTQ